MEGLKLKIHTDGACKGCKTGGWGALLQWIDVEKEVFGGELDTTNNRMELMAVIKGLEQVTRGVPILIRTDSKYVKNGCETWMANWKKNGWKTAAKKPVKNVDLWKELDYYLKKHDVIFEWVKGHSDDYHNDKADELANKGVLLIKGEL